MSRRSRHRAEIVRHPGGVARAVAMVSALTALAVAGCGSSSSSSEKTQASSATPTRTAPRQRHKPAVHKAKVHKTHRARTHKAKARPKPTPTATTSTPTTSSPAASTGSSSSGGSSGSKTKHHTRKPAPTRRPAHLVASFSAPNHTPKAGSHWVITVTARSSNGGPAPRAKVSYQFLLGAQVVSRQACKPVAPYTCRFNRAGVFHDDILWPARSAGIPLTLRTIVATAIGTQHFDWAVKVQK